MGRDEPLQEALTETYHLRTASPGDGRVFQASVRIDRTSPPWHVVVLAGSTFEPLRIRECDLAQLSRAGALLRAANRVSVQHDVRVLPSQDGLFTVLGVLAARWRAESGETLYQALSLA